MSAEDQSPEPPKPYSRIPAQVLLNLERRIEAHLRTHGNRNYHLLREDPEFAPFIGKDLADKGEKKLDRLIAKLRKTRPSIRAGALRGAMPAEKAQDQQWTPPAVEVLPATRAEILSGSQHAILGYDELQALVAQTLPRLRGAINNLHNERGEVEHNGDLVKLAREYRETIKDIAALQQQILSAVNSTKFHKRLFERLGVEFQDEPDRARNLFADLHELIRESGDLPVTTKELQ
jgi:hypothetical protein